MSIETTRLVRWSDGLQAGCERLVHPSVEGAERSRHCRLLSVLLAGPFVVAAAVMQGAATGFGVVAGLAVLCAVFGLSWLAALLVTTRGARREAEFIALGGGALLIGAAIAFGGGLGTPLAMLLAALPIEAIWVARSKRAAIAGGIAALAAMALALYIGSVASEAAGWLWLSPALYGLTLAARVLEAFSYSPQANANQTSLPDDCLDEAVVRLTRAGEVAAVSRRGGELFGVDPTLLLGSGLFERVHVADRVAFMCAAAEARDNGNPSRCVVRIRRPAMGVSAPGHFHTFEAEFVRTGSDADSVAILIRDAQDMAALRAELANAIDQAGAIEITKGRFLAAVSHELRTPLNAIIGFSDMLLHRDISGPLLPKQAEHISLIREAGNHLLSVVNAILDVSKIEAGSYRITVEPFDLKPAADLCCSLLMPQASEKGVNLTTRVPDNLGDVLGDQRAVQQILINLVSNAIKFTPTGGSVSLTATRRDDKVRLFVNDTGIGIAADDLAVLGKPFMQVQNDYTKQYQGTGLGLSLVKGLVTLHGGSMSIESAPGLGTTVTVTLPAAMSEGHRPSGDTGEDDGIALRKTA